MFEKPQLERLVYEADVETKFVFPFMTAVAPYGLSIPSDRIILKHNIKRLIVGKGADQKSYFPDFIVSFEGIPLLVVEVKRPDEDPVEGYRQARLYASELNAAFPTDINPVSFALATNGKLWLVGKSDHAAPIISASYDEFDVYSPKIADIINMVGFEALKKVFVTVASHIKPDRYFKPTRRLGGVAVRNQEVRSNTFGATISSELAHLFNPITKEDRKLVATDAYISSSHRSKYFDPIDKIIRAATPASETDSHLIKDTKKPTEILNVLEQGSRLEQKIMLVIGSVGSGKTTFVDYIQEVAISKELREKTLWVHINMNAAPLNIEEIYNFLRNEIINEIASAYPEVDLDDFKTLEKIYSVELNKFRKGVGRLYESDKATYTIKKAEILEKTQADRHATALCYCRYFGAERKRLVIIALDNCDKRTRDEQLFMFQAAQWLQKEFRALIILPLRDETYDNHRSEAPLDTALKDLVFRIEPPPFETVLISRVQLALNELGKSAPKNYEYALPNGMHIRYAASDQAHYLACIVSTIFHRAGDAKRLITGLSGKDLRRAFELFLEFCKSGHIGDDVITNIIKGRRDIQIPSEVVLRVLLRRNRRFYDDDSSYLKNIFACNVKDDRPYYFSNYLILKWLKERWADVGPTKLKGYHPISKLVNELAPYGLTEQSALRQVEIFVKASCITSEDFKVSELSVETLIRLAPAGFLHLEMARDPQYLSAISEDLWLDDAIVAKRIADRIGNETEQYSAQTTFYNSQELIVYLDGHKHRDLTLGLGLRTEELLTLPELQVAEASAKKLAADLQLGSWATADLDFYPGAVVDGIVDGRSQYGVFVELAPGMIGLAHVTKLSQPLEAYQRGQTIRVKVLSLAANAKKIELASL